MSSMPHRPLLTNRHRAMLKASDAGRGWPLCACTPDLLIDGRYCDQVTAHELFRAGLITIAEAGWVGQCVGARITDSGRSALEAT